MSMFCDLVTRQPMFKSKPMLTELPTDVLGMLENELKCYFQNKDQSLQGLLHYSKEDNRLIFTRHKTKDLGDSFVVEYKDINSTAGLYAISKDCVVCQKCKQRACDGMFKMKSPKCLVMRYYSDMVATLCFGAICTLCNRCNGDDVVSENLVQFEEEGETFVKQCINFLDTIDTSRYYDWDDETDEVVQDSSLTFVMNIAFMKKLLQKVLSNCQDVTLIPYKGDYVVDPTGTTKFRFRRDNAKPLVIELSCSNEECESVRKKLRTLLDGEYVDDPAVLKAFCTYADDAMVKRVMTSCIKTAQSSTKLTLRKEHNEMVERLKGDLAANKKTIVNLSTACENLQTELDERNETIKSLEYRLSELQSKYDDRNAELSVLKQLQQGTIQTTAPVIHSTTCCADVNIPVEVDELFDGEVLYQLLYTLDKYYKTTYEGTDHRSHRRQILESIFRCNILADTKSNLREQILSIFKTSDNYAATLPSKFRELGFTIESSGTNHFRVYPFGHKELSVTISATPSDYRSAENAATQIVNSIFM